MCQVRQYILNKNENVELVWIKLDYKGEHACLSDVLKGELMLKAHEQGRWNLFLVIYALKEWIATVVIIKVTKVNIYMLL